MYFEHGSRSRRLKQVEQCEPGPSDAFVASTYWDHQLGEGGILIYYFQPALGAALKARSRCRLAASNKTTKVFRPHSAGAARIESLCRPGSVPSYVSGFGGTLAITSPVPSQNLIFGNGEFFSKWKSVPVLRQKTKCLKQNARPRNKADRVSLSAGSQKGR